MKLFTNKEIRKKIIIAILLVMSFNFISPTISDADFGGALFKPISQLLQGIGDLVIKGLQKIFVGYGDIRVENPRKIRSRSI
jgi:hypothetical protein